LLRCSTNKSLSYVVNGISINRRNIVLGGVAFIAVVIRFVNNCFLIPSGAVLYHQLHRRLGG